MHASLTTFVPVAALLIVAPGPDVLLVIRNATRGRRSGLATAAGTLSGLLVHATAATVGLSALIATSAQAFTVVKILGAGYLLVLGVRTLWATRSAAVEGTPEGGTSRPAPRITTGVALRQGALTNVLNPKVAVFFVAFLPQFLAHDSRPVAGTALLATVFVLMSGLYLAALVFLTVRAAAVLTRPAVKRRLDRLAGVLFIGFGVRLATEQR